MHVPQEPAHYGCIWLGSHRPQAATHIYPDLCLGNVSAKGLLSILLGEGACSWTHTNLLPQALCPGVALF